MRTKKTCSRATGTLIFKAIVREAKLQRNDNVNVFSLGSAIEMLLTEMHTNYIVCASVRCMNSVVLIRK